MDDEEVWCGLGRSSAWFQIRVETTPVPRQAARQTCFAVTEISASLPTRTRTRADNLLRSQAYVPDAMNNIAVTLNVVRDFEGTL